MLNGSEEQQKGGGGRRGLRWSRRKVSVLSPGPRRSWAPGRRALSDDGDALRHKAWDSTGREKCDRECSLVSRPLGHLGRDVATTISQAFMSKQDDPPGFTPVHVGRSPEQIALKSSRND